MIYRGRLIRGAENAMPGIAEVISAYILAKDTNRPWLMQAAFSAHARLEMDVRSGAIAFPAGAAGLEEITETLVRRFSSENENIYTFCLARAPKSDAPQYACNWLVGMARKDTGEIRIGCGRYEWAFSKQPDFLADGLKITIEMMELLAPRHGQPVMQWLAGLPYPWCPPQTALQGIPALEELAPVSGFLAKAEAG